MNKATSQNDGKKTKAKKEMVFKNTSFINFFIKTAPLQKALFRSTTCGTG